MASAPLESYNFEMPRGSCAMQATPRGRANTEGAMRHFDDDEDAFSVTGSFSKSAPVGPQASAIFSLTWERKASDLQNGCYLLVGGRPCKCHRVTFTRGQVHVRAKDIFTGEDAEASFRSDSHVEVPIVKRHRYQCVALDEDTGIASLRNEKGVVRRDLQMPVKGNDGGLRRQVSTRTLFDMEQYLQALSRGSTLNVIVQVAVGQEEIVSASYDEHKGVGGAFFAVVAKLKAHAKRVAAARAERREVLAGSTVMEAGVESASAMAQMSICASVAVSQAKQSQSICVPSPVVSALASLEDEASPADVEHAGVRLISDAAA